jgi:hypothetical protein
LPALEPRELALDPPLLELELALDPPPRALPRLPPSPRPSASAAVPITKTSATALAMVARSFDLGVITTSLAAAARRLPDLLGGLTQGCVAGY